MTINHNKLKEANVLYINRFTVEFLKRFLQIFYKGFIWRGGLERLDALLMMLLPDYFGYTQEIVKKISQKYPDKFENKHVKEILPDIIHRTRFDLDSYQEQESLKIFRDITIEHLDRICFPKVSPLNTFEKAEKKLSKYLGLKKYQIKLITTFHILKKYNNFDEMLNCCNFYDIENIEKMCTCIGFKIEEYIEAKNILLEIGNFLDYVHNRISIEDASKGFLKNPVEKWDVIGKEGFFYALDNKINEWTGWNYVYNERGGFLGLWCTL